MAGQISAQEEQVKATCIVNCCGAEVLAAIVLEVLAGIWRRHCRATIVQVLADRAACTVLVMDAV